MNKAILTELDATKTVRRPGRRGLETWEATSADGLYGYVRWEDDTTNWQVAYLPTGFLFPDFFGTLTSARKWTATEDCRVQTLALTLPVESAGFHTATAVAVLKSTTSEPDEDEEREPEDCDYCGSGRPCRCTADSTDPIENIYGD